MRKALSILSLFFLLTAAAPAEITHEGRSDLKPRQRMGFVFKRGVINAFSSPMEVVRAYKIEKAAHPKWWPATYPFAAFYNFFMRISSAG